MSRRMLAGPRSAFSRRRDGAPPTIRAAASAGPRFSSRALPRRHGSARWTSVQSVKHRPGADAVRCAGPGLHRHLNTVENFLCLSGRFEIAWGDQGEHTLLLEPLDMISVPRGENRSFRNVSNELGRLLVMIVPETDEQADPIRYAPSVAKEIEDEYGKSALEGLQKLGFAFEDVSTMS
jgi:mannose-6-phosphate isomerase-like protein (cupin superfamily)